jgi:hypothetical protein
MYSAVNVQFLENHSAEDFAAGLAYATDREWLSNENTVIRLTQSGFESPRTIPTVDVRDAEPQGNRAAGT